MARRCGNLRNFAEHARQVGLGRYAHGNRGALLVARRRHDFEPVAGGFIAIAAEISDAVGAMIFTDIQAVTHVIPFDLF